MSTSRFHTGDKRGEAMKRSPLLAPSSPKVGDDSFLAAERLGGQRDGTPRAAAPASFKQHLASHGGEGNEPAREAARRQAVLSSSCPNTTACATFPLGTHVNRAHAVPAAFHLLNSVYVFHPSLPPLCCKPIPLCVCARVLHLAGPYGVFLTYI